MALTAQRSESSLSRRVLRRPVRLDPTKLHVCWARLSSLAVANAVFPLFELVLEYR